MIPLKITLKKKNSQEFTSVRGQKTRELKTETLLKATRHKEVETPPVFVDQNINIAKMATVPEMTYTFNAILSK